MIPRCSTAAAHQLPQGMDDGSKAESNFTFLGIMTPTLAPASSRNMFAGKRLRINVAK